MKRIVAYAMAVLVIALPTGAAALGLGDINLHSALNEPLDAEIELLSVGRGEAEDINVALAKGADFQRAGLDRPFWLSKLRFRVQADPDGKVRIKVTTPQPIREPFLNFLMEVNWPKGRLLREYTVLLDPPVYSAVAAARVAEPVVRAPAEPASLPLAHIVDKTPEQVSKAPEAPVSTPSEPASVSPQVVEAPAVISEPITQVELEPAPAAESVAEPAMPDPAYALPSKPAFEPVEPMMVTRAQAEPRPVGRSLGPYSFGPTEAGDTLWSIANRVRPESVTANQMMLALLRANPEAFDSANVNTLKVGQVLRVPKLTEIQTVSQADALEEVKGQHAFWEEYGQQVAERAGPAPIGEVADVVTTEEPMVEEDETRLQLLSAGAGEAGLSGVAGGEADMSALRQELAVVMEDLDSKRQENEDLTSRLEETEDLIGDLQRLIQLKDDTLASLQARLAELERAAQESGELQRLIQRKDDTLASLQARLAELERAAQGSPVAVEPMAAEIPTQEAFEEAAPGLPAEQEMEEAPIAEMPPSAEAEMVESMPEMEADTAELPQQAEESAVAPEAGVSPVEEASPAEVVQAEEPQIRPTPILPPPPASEPESFLDSILGSLPVDKDTLVLAGGGLGALALVGVLVMILLRRRRGGSGEEEAAAEDAFLYEDLTGTAAEEETETTELIEEPRTEPGAEPEELEEAVPEEQRTLVAGQTLAPEVAPKEEDPLAEVNVYLAYERFDQAGELVRAAVEEYPDRPEYKLKLLEVHYAAKNADAFEKDAVLVRDAVGEDSPLMEKARGWWQELSPDRNLFERQEASADPEPVTEDDAFESTVAALRVGEKVDFEQARDQAAGGGEQAEVDFDLGFSEGGAEEEASDALDMDEESQTLELGDALDFELPSDSRVEEAPQPVASAEEDNVVDFDLDFDVEETQADATVEEEAPLEEAALDFDLDGGEDTAALEKTRTLDFELGAMQDAESEDEETGGLDLDLGLNDTAETEAEDVEKGDGLDLEIGAQNQADEPEAADERTGPLDFEIGPDASVVELTDQAEGAAPASLSSEAQIPVVEDVREPDDQQLDLSAFADETTAEEALFDAESSEASRAPDLSVEFGEAAEASLDQADDFNLESEMSSVEAAGFDLNLDVAGDGEEEQMFGLDGDMVGEIDEVGTKLDLAQAYVDMGDSDGARNILNEVLTEGSDEQREEAQTLLTRLG